MQPVLASGLQIDKSWDSLIFQGGHCCFHFPSAAVGPEEKWLFVTLNSNYMLNDRSGEIVTSGDINVDIKSIALASGF
ncbi:hypothetical protein HispidOSU_001412, partial [Sigmodon hispidus]